MHCHLYIRRTDINIITVHDNLSPAIVFPVQANEIFLRNASQNEVDDLLASLAEATNVNATGDSTIFPQDLSTTNLIVKSSVNYLIQNIESAGPMSSLNFSEVRL